MSPQQILDEVRRILAERLRIASAVEPRTDILRDLQLDSVQQLSLVVELENHFRICFDPDDEEGLSTIESVVQLIARRLAEAGPATEAQVRP